ncbi:MAG: RdgB/HAM1 family non-canonical purine NTP pyrophosphatase [Solirubrobacterales bacterium]
MILASRNPHKLREFGEIEGLPEVEPLPDGVELPPEEAPTFAGNALGKARAAREATGQEAIADDSGLVVDGLDGAPGVRSARFAGEGATDSENLELLIESLESVPAGSRTARYVCALAHVSPDGAEQVVEGVCEGVLVTEPRGSGGFGYDPIFVPTDTGPSDDRTMAELSSAEKHAISHRGRAARLLAERLSGS